MKTDLGAQHEIAPQFQAKEVAVVQAETIMRSLPEIRLAIRLDY